MKIIHTADWHLGKRVHEFSMIEEQKHILGEFIKLLKEEKPDVLLIAGDVYDRAVPPNEAVELLNSFLAEVIIELKIKVILSAGNHDSVERLNFGQGIFKKSGLHINAKFDGNITPITIEDEHGVVNFYSIPFIEPSDIRFHFNNEISSYDDAYKVLVDKLRNSVDYDQRNVCMVHAYLVSDMIVNHQVSESVRRLTIGGTEYVNCEHFKDFNYVALGHLHRNQKVKYDHIRYSGSLLKYSFSEHNHKKSFTIINMNQDGQIEIEQRSIKPLRDLRVISGNLNSLIDKKVYSLENQDDYIFAQLTDEGELVDPMSTLRSIYPNIMKLEKVPNQRVVGEDSIANGDIKKRDIIELFSEFYENTSGKEFNDKKLEVVKGFVDEINRERRKR